MTANCDKCGAQMADNLAVCPDCGAQAPKRLPLKSTQKLEPAQVQKIMLAALALGAAGYFLFTGKIIFAIAALVGVAFAFVQMNKKKNDGNEG